MGLTQVFVVYGVLDDKSYPSLLHKLLPKESLQSQNQEYHLLFEVYALNSFCDRLKFHDHQSVHAHDFLQDVEKIQFHSFQTTNDFFPN